MAAGLGFKTFTTGEVLTAADTNGYLMQGVLVFATSAARDAAITSPQEGQIAYLKSDDAIYKYTGASWTNIDTSGSAPVNKNYLINGGFAIAQRGTSFTASNNNDDAYTLDRWYILSDSNDVIDVTQDTTTVPTNGQFAIALDVETINKKFGIATIIENKDVIGLVGNTVTFSFKAKVSSTTKLDNVKAAIVAWSGTADTVTSDIISAWGVEGTNPTLIANATYENSPVNLNLTTSYATYSVSAAVDTASTNNLILFVWSDVTDTTLGDFLFIAQAKLELGSTATAFEYAGGTIQGELAACQRYYYRQTSADDVFSRFLFGSGDAINTATVRGILTFPVIMRIEPTTFDSSAGATFSVYDGVTSIAATAIAFDRSTKFNSEVGASATGLTTYRPYWIISNNTTSAHLGFSAEL